MGGVGVEGDVRKNRKLWELLLNGSDSALDQPFGIEGFLGVWGA
jgi:hypothetical protein